MCVNCPNGRRTPQPTDPDDAIARAAARFTAVNVHASGLTSVSATTASGHKFVYRRSWHVVADIRTRVNEVKTIGDDVPTRHKLFGHVVCISISAFLTIAITFLAAVWLHWDGVIPILPSWIQEVWDWIYKY